MKFSGNRLYVEEYVKCANCGVLIYVDRVEPIREGHGQFCSEWCVEWATARRAEAKAAEKDSVE